MRMIDLYLVARRVGVPLVAVSTADQNATVEAIRAADDANLPLVRWDCARGLAGINPSGVEAVKRAGIKEADTYGFAPAMRAVDKLPEGTAVLAHNAHRFLQSSEPAAIAGNVQAVANLRDTLKMNFRMLVMLGPGFALPAELARDVVLLAHELPSPGELRTVVAEVHQSAAADAQPGAPALAPLAAEALDRAGEAVSGLTLFEAEQATSMSLSEAGLDLGLLLERKRSMIETTPGLKIYRGTERFDDLVGLDAMKSHLRRRLTGRTPVGVIVWLDEIDKALANVEGDSSGVRMDQLRVLLTEMEDNEWKGLIAVGVSGGGKSAIVKAFGNEAQALTIAVDLGATESKWVGESEANIRRLMATVKAVGGGNAYFMATSNNASVMRPELQRRFTDGVWMVDLLTAAERKAAWALYMRKYELAAQPLPNDEGWTAAEVRNACRYAWDTRCTVLEASQFIVPMSRSRASDIEDLRRFAHNRLLDATRPGAYQYSPEPMAKQIRAISLPSAGGKKPN